MTTHQTRQAARRRASMTSMFAVMTLAVVMILGAGIFADLRTREAALENHRATTRSRLDTHAAAVERELRTGMRGVSELGFAFVGGGADDFGSVAAPMVDGPSSVRGVAVTKADGTDLVYPDTPAMPTCFACRTTHRAIAPARA